MFLDHVLGRLKAMAGEGFVKRRVLSVSGLGESAVDEIAAPIYGAFPDVQTSILFNKSEVQIHIAARSEIEIVASTSCDKLADELIRAIGKAVFAGASGNDPAWTIL